MRYDVTLGVTLQRAAFLHFLGPQKAARQHRVNRRFTERFLLRALTPIFALVRALLFPTRSESSQKGTFNELMITLNTHGRHPLLFLLAICIAERNQGPNLRDAGRYELCKV